MAIDKAIILAAGASQRLGQPKALVEVGESTLVEIVAGRLDSAGLEVTIVTRAELVEPIRALLPEAHLVVNHEPEAGRTGSIQCGLASIGGGPVLVAPVDRPGFSLSTVETLCQEESSTCPTKDGRGGHPIALSAADCESIREASPDTPLRDLIEPQRSEVADPHLHLNIDTPEDIEALRRVASAL